MAMGDRDGDSGLGFRLYRVYSVFPHKQRLS